MLPARQNHPADRDHVHAADSFADDGEGVVPDFAVRDQIVGPDEESRIDIALGTNSSMSMVRVESARCFPARLRYFNVGVGIDLVALHDVFGGNFLAGIRSTFMYLMRWPVFRLIWLKLIFSESEVAGRNIVSSALRVCLA